MTKQLLGLLVIALFMISLPACEDAGADLDMQVKRALRGDNTIDETEWNTIKEYVNLNRGSLEGAGCNCFTDSDLGKKIEDVAKTRRKDGDVPPNICCAGVATTTTANPLKFKLFLEASGSMYPYTEGNTGFKDAIYELLTNIPKSGKPDNALYYIGSVIFPIEKTVQEFIGETNPYTIAKKNKTKINTSATDINKIIKLIFDNASNDEINILVSDCIYSIKGDAKSSLSKLQYATKDVIKNQSNFSTLVLQLNSQYNGTYYNYKNGKTDYNDIRPYYMLIFGNSSAMDRLMYDKDYRDIQNFKGLKGFENLHYFSNNTNKEEPHFSILSSTNKAGSFRRNKDKADRTAIKGIMRVKEGKKGGEEKLQFSVAVDMGDTYIGNDFKTNPANFDVKAEDDFKIESIEKVSDVKVEDSDKKYLGSATHIMTLSIPKLSAKKQDITIGLKEKLSTWINDASTDDDTDINANKGKTFGFKYLMNGINEAYNSTGETAYHFTVTCSLEK